jgi:hypothetical protein
MDRLRATAIICLTLIVPLCFSIDNADTGFINHPVKKGESVSLICIDYYGYYSKELGAAFQKDNPGVKDINVIFPGQTLRFRSPREAKTRAAGASSAAAAPADTLFDKKVAVQQGVVTCVEGAVTLFRKGSTAGETCAVNTVVTPGDRIITSASGRVEIIINRETVVRLREKTSATIEAYRNPGKDRGKTKIGFSAGAVWTKMKRFQDKISRFELELPNAIAGVHGTVYQAAINPDNSSEVKVFSGEVAVQGKTVTPGSLRQGHGKGAHEVAGPSEVQGPTEVDLETWVRIVRSMQQVVIDKNGNASGAKPFSWDTTSSWESWNRERDLRIQEMFKEK